MSLTPKPTPCRDHPGIPPVLRKSLSGSLVYYACPVRGCRVSGWSSDDEPTARDSWQWAVHGGPLFSAGVLAFLALPASAGTLGGPAAGGLGWLPWIMAAICALIILGCAVALVAVVCQPVSRGPMAWDGRHFERRWKSLNEDEERRIRERVLRTRLSQPQREWSARVHKIGEDGQLHRVDEGEVS